MTTSKICTYCQAEKPVDHFYNDKSRKDGKDHRCKTCKDQQSKAYLLRSRLRVNQGDATPHAVIPRVEIARLSQEPMTSGLATVSREDEVLLRKLAFELGKVQLRRLIERLTPETSPA